MSAKIVRIPTPRRNQFERAILAELRALRREVAELKQVAPPLAWWEQQEQQPENPSWVTN
ncbi:MAG: hypothetical protein WAU60_17875 [Candidatus Competibacter denitrificans]